MKKNLALGLMFLLSTLLWAGDGKWILRGRLITVAPNEDSTQIGATGSEVAVDDAFVPELDLTYMFNANWGLEVIAATSPHDLSAKGGALDGADAGEVWVLPPTFTLQYHFGSNSNVDFYLGVGLNFSLFHSYDVSDDLVGLGVNDIDFDNSVGPAGNMGFDFKINENWVFNLDVKYIGISTDADLKLATGGTLDTVEVDINPIVAGIGIGYRF